MEIDDEERELRIPRTKISRKPLTSIVVEDDEELSKKIMELREKERKEEEEKEKELYNPKNLVVITGERWKKILEEKEKFLKKMEEADKKARKNKRPKPPPPPLYNNDVGVVDASDACLVVVDVNDVKQAVLNEDFMYHYNWLLTFAVECRYKCCLEMFDHPGIPCTFVRIKNKEKLHHVAAFAIDYYNKICKNARLELTDIVRINRYGGCCCRGSYYVTLHAEDKNTGQIGLYQAAVVEHYTIDNDDDDDDDDDNSDKYLLGLLRDCCGDRILAIISLTGADEDLEKRRKELVLM